MADHPSSTPPLQVIVIGAGAAGLAAARHLHDTGCMIAWSSDPWAKMRYSYVPVDGVGLRAQLAQALSGVLFFAGEATHVTRGRTVHGALESGIRAAYELLATC